MDFSQILPILAGAAVLIVVLVLLVRRAVARRKALRNQLFQEHGFYEIPDDAELIEKVAQLKKEWKEGNRIRNIQYRSEWGYKLYIFDLIEKTGESVKTSTDVGLLLSADLTLPRFTMLPKAEGDGIIAALANRVVAWVASKFAHRVAFPDHPQFDAARSVFGDDESAVRQCLAGRRLDRLAELPDILMDCGDDAILFQQFSFQTMKQSDRERLNSLMETARSLYDIFKEP